MDAGSRRRPQAIERERTVVRTPLAVRFWDPALGQPVRDGLIATIARPEAPQRRYPGLATPGGYHVFHDVDGLAAFVRSAARDLPAPAAQRLRFEVVDRLDRYLPLRRAVDLPAQGAGPFLSTLKPRPGDQDEPGFLLFSAPTRTTPPGYAGLRGRCWHAAASGPGSFAVLEARRLVSGNGDEVEVDAEPWLGIADARGEFLLIVPFPAMPPPAGPDGGGDDGGEGNGATRLPPLDRQSIRLRLSLRFDGSIEAPKNGVAAPDLFAVMAQPPARFRPTAAHTEDNPDPDLRPVEALTVEVGAVADAVIETEGTPAGGQGLWIALGG